MNVTVRDDEVQTFRDLLRDYLPALRSEVARIDAAEFQHVLAKREAVCEHLLEQLRSPYHG